MMTRPSRRLLQLIYFLVTCVQCSKNVKCGDYDVQQRCLFIVSTGRSGSTALQAALNQIDNVFIRGENYGTFYHFETIYNNIKQLSNQKFESDDDKKLFNEFAAQKKPAHFNAFPNITADCLIKVTFKMMYGYKQFSDFIVGFKEIRFAPWTKIPVINYGKTYHNEIFVQPKETQEFIMTDRYQAFEDRLEFLKRLCVRPQIVLNLRRNPTKILKSGFFVTPAFKRSNKIKDTDVEKYASWILKFGEDHSKDTFIVYYDDMFDSSINQTLAKNLVEFLNVEQTNISFWGTKKDKYKKITKKFRG